MSQNKLCRHPKHKVATSGFHLPEYCKSTLNLSCTCKAAVPTVRALTPPGCPVRRRCHQSPNSPVCKGGRRAQLNRCGDRSWPPMHHSALRPSAGPVEGGSAAAAVALTGPGWKEGTVSGVWGFFPCIPRSIFLFFFLFFFNQPSKLEIQVGTECWDQLIQVQLSGSGDWALCEFSAPSSTSCPFIVPPSCS